MKLAEMDFGLPALTTDRLPEFVDQDSCRKWLAGLPLTNVTLVQARLNYQLRLLNRYPLDAGERLKILELLRDPIDFVQEQYLQRYAGRPLPFDTPAQAAFDAGQALWQELLTGYLHCLRATLENAAAEESSPHLTGSLATTRALLAMSAIYLGACRANFLTAPMFWRQVHAIFHAAEELKVTQLPVEDKLRRNLKATAASVYVEMLLLAAASPLELRSRQLSLVADWAQRWAEKVSILQQPPADRRTPPLCVDLDSDQTAAFQSQPANSAALRWLELSGLRKSIKKRLVLLAQGESPQALHLGAGCVQPACAALLGRVYQCWCRGGLKQSAIKSDRRVKSSCHLVSGFESILHSLTGQKSLDRDRSIYLSTHQHEEIATFGRVTRHRDDGKAETPGAILEEWRIVDQDAAQLQLERHLGAPGNALVGAQLVAVRMQNSEEFMLGKVSWIAVNASRDGLIARIQLFPGRPAAMTLRSPDPGSRGAQCARGLFLPDVGQLGAAASVIAPPGWFAADRIVSCEMPTHGSRRLRLDRLSERGADFEQIAFEWL